MKPTINFSRDSKSVLAKLLSEENIDVIYTKRESAAFDPETRTLNMPVLTADCPESVSDLFVLHEVGHARFTPADGWHTAPTAKGRGYRSFLNIVEDARIEKLIKRKFAGANRRMTEGYNELFSRDFFGISKLEIPLNDLPIIDRINLFTKCGVRLDINFNETEQALLDRVMATETWDDVVSVCDDLFAYSKEEKAMTDIMEEFEDLKEDDYDEDEEDNQDGPQFEGSEGDPEEQTDEVSQQPWDDLTDEEKQEEIDKQKENPAHYDEEGEDSPNDSESKDDEEKMGDLENQKSEQGDEQSEEAGEENAEESAGSDEEKNSDEAEEVESAKEAGESSETNPHSFTDQFFRNSEDEFVDPNAGVRYYLDLPETVDYEKHMVPTKAIMATLDKCWNESHYDYDPNPLYEEFMKKTAASVKYLVKEFEMRKAAAAHKRTTTSKTGVLDMKKIHSYKFCDDLFLRVGQVQDGQSHGMVFLLDWSGSMGYQIKETVEQVLVLAQFCRMVNIPFKILGFTCNWKQRLRGYSTEKHDGYDEPNSVYVDAYVSLLDFVNSDLSKADYIKASKYLLNMGYMLSTNTDGYRIRMLPAALRLSSTPLDEALIIMRHFLPDFQKKHQVERMNLVVLTDGQSSSLRYNLDRHQGYGGTVIAVDPKTKAKFEVDHTKSILEWVKEVTGVTTIGFYISGLSDLRNVWFREGNDRHLQLNEILKEKKVFDFAFRGYDRHFMAKTNDMVIKENDYLSKLDDGASTTKISTAFKRMNRGNSVNKVLLNGFIDEIR